MAFQPRWPLRPTTIPQGDVLVAHRVPAGFDRGGFTMRIEMKDTAFGVDVDLTERERTLLKAGGVLPYAHDPI